MALAELSNIQDLTFFIQNYRSAYRKLTLSALYKWQLCKKRFM